MLSKASLLALGGVIVPAIAETILGVAVYTRHGDREYLQTEYLSISVEEQLRLLLGTTKHYKAQALTNLGFQQNFQVGGDYRSIYLSSNSSRQILGISENKYVPSQIYATAPDQAILLNAATAFLQGLYPPLENLDPSALAEKINNGTSWTAPLGGYQYITLHGEDVNSPDTIWIKGDEDCPAVTSAAATFKQSTEYKVRHESTKSFYARFWEVLESVYDYRPENLTYANAFDIFDLINVAKIHNNSLASNVTEDELFQLRTLADSAEWALNYNKTRPARSIGGQTLAGAILNQLNKTITSKGALKFSLLSGSYDNFLAFFGISNLTVADPNFFGLPSYASTMAFELFTEKETTGFPSNIADINVRFLFRNGSGDGTPLSAFPLFGRTATTMSWTEFTTELSNRAISSVEQWCKSCSNTDGFCLQYIETVPSAHKNGMSNAVAGVIGAIVTLGVIASCGLVFWLLRKKRAGQIGVTSVENPTAEKTASIGSSRVEGP